MPIKSVILLLFFAFGAGQMVFSSPGVIVINNDSAKIELSGGALMLEDSASVYKADDIINFSETKLTEPPTGTNFFSNAGVLWQIIRVRNNTDNSSWHLLIPFSDTAEVYYYSAKKNTGYYLAGTDLPVEHWPIKKVYPTNSFCFPFNLPKDSTVTIILKRVNTHYLYREANLIVGLQKAETGLRISSYDAYFLGFFNGLLLLLIIFSFWLFLLFRERNFLLFAFSISFYMLATAINLGTFADIFKTIPFNYFFIHFDPVVYVLSYISVALFTLRFIKSYAISKKMTWLVILLVAINCVPCFIRTYSAFQVLQLLQLSWMVLITIICFMGLKQKRVEPLVFLIVMFFFVSGLSINVLASLGTIPKNEFTNYSDRIGMIWSSILYPAFILHRVTSIRKEKEELIIRQNVTLENKVKDRTKQLEESNQMIQNEHNRSEQLLLNILPQKTAIELKETGKSEAKLFNDVTVLFTDFKSFTTVSERLSPQQLVDELHACFSAFDKIVTKYNIEKIKTVGDAYLAVSGLPLPNLNHAEDMVNAALDIREFMLNRRTQLGEKTFEIRIGIHSGSVVAGIVGVKKFAYDIWGDTVNTAARMEQNSEAGKINISQTTYELVKDKFNCEYRGEIEAKNKGLLKMYFVG